MQTYSLISQAAQQNDHTFSYQKDSQKREYRNKEALPFLRFIIFQTQE